MLADQAFQDLRGLLNNGLCLCCNLRNHEKLREKNQYFASFFTPCYPDSLPGLKGVGHLKWLQPHSWWVVTPGLIGQLLQALAGKSDTCDVVLKSGVIGRTQSY